MHIRGKYFPPHSQKGSVMAATTKSVLIEVGEESVGILVETAQGLVFHAVHPKLFSLNNTKFRSVAAAQAAAISALKGLAKAG